MDVRSLGIGAILFGVLVLGGTVDGARRKIMSQPLWFAQSWKTALKGAIIWIIVGVVALVGGVLALLA